MEKRINKITILWLSIILIYTSVYYLIFLGIAEKGQPKGERFDRLFLILMILVFAFHTIKLYKLNIRNSSIYSVLLFLYSYTLCAIFSLTNFGLITRYLPTILYVLLSFFFFFYLSFSGKISSREITIFYVVFIVIASLAFWKAFSYKSQLYKDVYLHGNGVGYLFVLLLPAIALIFKKKNILLIITSFLFMIIILNSSKRGAIITGVCLVSYIIFFNIKIKQQKKIYKFLIIIITAILLYGVYYYVQTEPTMFQRFEKEGGSGRDWIYSGLLNAWMDGNFLKLLIGNGFFSTTTILEAKFGSALMAHNDWLQALCDIGIIGFFVYLYMFISFLKQRPIIKRYQPDMLLSYDLCLFIWMTKSMVSGLFMDKASMVLFSCLGLIIGFSIKRKNDYRMLYLN